MNSKERLEKTVEQAIKKRVFMRQRSERCEGRQEEKYRPKRNNKMEYLKEKFKEKLYKEYIDYVRELEKSTPKTITENAYKLTVKKEMIYVITEKEYTISELRVLLKSKEILEECYDEWLKSDGNFTEIFEDSVEKRIKNIIDKESNKKKNRESR